jgi:hypothetical protein
LVFLVVSFPLAFPPITYIVLTSQETHYVSATEPNRLMLFGETVAVYCENHTEHTECTVVCTPVSIVTSVLYQFKLYMLDSKDMNTFRNTDAEYYGDSCCCAGGIIVPGTFHAGENK